MTSRMISVAVAVVDGNKCSPEHKFLTTIEVSLQKDIGGLRGVVLADSHVKEEFRGVRTRDLYVECVTGEGNDQNGNVEGYFLEDRSALRDSKNKTEVRDVVELVIWTVDVITDQSEIITSRLAKELGALARVTGPGFLEISRRVTGGVGDVIQGTYYQHLLFVRKARDQAYAENAFGSVGKMVTIAGTWVMGGNTLQFLNSLW